MSKAAIYDPYLDTLGGGERYCLTVAEILLKNGYSVDLFWSGDKSFLDKAKQRFNLDLSGINIVDDIFNLSKNNSKKYNFFEKYQITKKYDLVFFLTDGSLPFLFSGCNLLHIQVPFNQSLSISQKIINFFKLLLIKKVVCNSEFTTRFVKKNLSSKTTVLYPPIDVDKLISSAHKENIILSVGRFDNILNAKKQDVLIDAFKKLIDQNRSSDWKLILAGGSLELPKDNTYLKHLQYKAKKYPIEFLVNPDFTVLQQTYSKSKIYWHAAGFEVDELKNPQNTEHFGMAVVEAMASGSIPVVVSKGGLKEIITNDVDGFLWNNTAELISKTQLLIGSPSILAKMSKSAKVKSAVFSKQNFEKSLLSICCLK